MAVSLAETLHGGPITLEEVDRVTEALIFAPGQPGGRFIKFSLLLLLASGIATFGLLGDSLAVVIGAMIVAPLMLPIMGLAFSISLGDRRRIISTLLVSLAGIGMAVGVGFALTLPVASLLVPQAIEQVMARTQPHLFDLMAALATGVAGAFALARRDVSDTLPGVAIAVSLVPPLANVGILLALGEPALAGGSLVLFLTNYVAILLTGSLVFMLMGFRQVALAPFDPRARRRALSLAVVALLLLSIPLTLSSYRLIIRGSLASRTATLARDWLRGTDYRLLSVKAETVDGAVEVLLAGNGELPPIQRIEAQAQELLPGRSLHVQVLESRSYRIAGTAR
ncbi:MAG: DUF389 domain-containing protein [Synechococcaceae cyanobacterium]|nr:DUF389 domain-containing protein [Synechococcaceae cyanobacterium]